MNETPSSSINEQPENLKQTASIQSTGHEDELSVLRSETVLSRYPIHRLANKGLVNIEIRKRDAAGNIVFLWEVSHSSRYGQPGPLAYKLDTLVINRRIDEAGRPVPKVLRLGSLAEIARELDLGADTNKVKRALRQNAFAGITARTLYRGQDGQEYAFEFSDTRYGVVFTGETLPDGSRSDAVYLIFHDLYLEVLNRAPRRPLDYRYLQSLPPGPQRFYEIISYAMFPAIKYGHRARLAYSEFCQRSTLTRYYDFDQVKKQMYKIHLPHVRSGYIARVEYESTEDEEGQPDWIMFYTPGETATAQQSAFDGALSPARKSRRKTDSADSSRQMGAEAKETAGEPERRKRAGEGKRTASLARDRAADPGDAPEPEQQERARTKETREPADPPASEAEKLVRRFYRHRYGQEQTPTEPEIREALQYLEEGAAWAVYLIDFAAQQGREANGFPNGFGGVKKLISQAREPFEVKCRERRAASLKKARQSHEDAHRDAYHAFLGQLLGGGLETSLPEVYRAFLEQERSIYQFHKARAGKSPMSAQVVEGYYDEEQRVRRLLKYLEENPRCGIPTFWQWDERINTHPFRPPAEP